MNVVLKSLGCRLNEAELEHWATGFQAAGYRLSNSADDADLVVVNTCAVTGEAVKKIQTIDTAYPTPQRKSQTGSQRLLCKPATRYL